MAYNSTTWSPEALTKASETSAAELNNATLSGTLTVSGATQLNSTLTVGASTDGHDVYFYGDASGKYLKWDESVGRLHFPDNVSASLGTSYDMTFSHTGSSGFITNKTGALNIATTVSGIAVSIGHTTSVTAINDELDITGTVDINDTTDSSSTTSGALKVDGGVGIAKKLYVGTDLDVDGTANLDDTDIDGTLVVDGSNISLDSTSTLNIDNSNTSNGITIGTATSGVPISIGHTTSETTVNDNLTVTGDLTVTGNNISGSGGGVITFSGDDIYLADNLYLNTNNSEINFGAASNCTLFHNTNIGLILKSGSAQTNTVLQNFRVQHYTSNTPAAGIGAAITLEVETLSGVTHTGVQLSGVTTDVTDDEEDFDFTVSLMEGGSAVAERMRLTSAGQLILPGAGTIALKETTTPTAVTDYGRIYCKNDNKLYFQDGAGTEHEISFA